MTMKGFLREFLSSCGIVQTSAEESVDGIPVAFKKLCERRLRPALVLEHQLFIALHECRLHWQ
jgi:hypothetical protein